MFKKRQQMSKPTIYKCVLNRIAAPNPTQISKAGKKTHGAYNRPPRSLGGTPAEGAGGGPPAPPWATPPPPWGPRGGIDWGGHIRILYKAPKDTTEPRNTIQRHKVFDKAPKHYTKPQQTLQRPRRLYKDIKC